MKETKISGGRIGVYVPDHPGASNSGYILRSRYVMEQKLGRRLDTREHVHHKNGNKIDDDPDNLELIDVADHTRLHSKEKRKLDYDKVTSLRKEGLGYKKISRLLGYPQGSVKYAVRIVDKEINGGDFGIDRSGRAKNAIRRAVTAL